MTNTTVALKNMPYANAKVVKWSDGTIHLVSYSTIVIEVDSEGFVTCSGLYSRTTMRHISNFAREYLNPLDYYDVKKAWQGGYKINYRTGEIIMI